MRFLFCGRSNHGQTIKDVTEHCWMDYGQELDSCCHSLRPADSRPERLQLRQARDHAITGFARLDHLDSASRAGDILDRDLEAEAADPPDCEFGVERDPAEAAALFSRRRSGDFYDRGR